MTRTRVGIGLVLLGLFSACSKSSTGPNDPVLGAWHVTAVAMDSGTFAPLTFTLTMRASGRGYAATLPSMTYNTTAFDSSNATIQFSYGGDTIIAIGQFVLDHGDTLAGVRVARGATVASACEYAFMHGVFNAARDSIVGSIDIIDNGQDNTGCAASGAFRAVKG